MTELFLIRHGQTPWTKERRYQGHTDTNLTAHGKQQAQALARRLRSIKFDVIYSSPLKRARETAKILAAGVKAPVRVDAALKEISFGNWEGRSVQELIQQKEPGFLDWHRGKFVRPPGGESMPHFRKRIRQFLKKILKRHPDDRLAIVAHGGPVKILLFEVLKLPTDFWWIFRAEPASLSRVFVAPGVRQVVLWNDLSHLKNTL